MRKNHTDMVNINSFIFNRKQSVITANLKASSNQVSIIVPYKVDTGSDGHIMPLHLYKSLFPRAIKEQWVATKNKKIQLNNWAYVKVKIEHNNKQKMCKFFVVPANGKLCWH